MTSPSTPSNRLQWVRERMENACRAAGRAPDSVDLLAVTKTRSVEEMQDLQRLGLLRFGENRVGEAGQKIPRFDSSVEWHMIGHLQSNKAKECLGFSWLQSLDSLSTARALENVFAKAGKTLNVLLEVNTGEEEQKSGTRTFEELQQLVDQVSELPHLKCRGLMTMAPFTKDEVVVRRCFSRLYAVRESLETTVGRGRLPVLSMGMSNDFEWAIREGSTMVRIGTLLFEAAS